MFYKALTMSLLKVRLRKAFIRREGGNTTRISLRISSGSNQIERVIY